MGHSLAIMAALLLLGNGCTLQMWQHGWAEQTISSGVGTGRDARAPTATKNQDGDIVFEYEVLRYQLNGLGNPIGNPPPLRRGRVTKITLSRSLQAVTNNAFLSRNAVFPVVTNETGFATNGQSLPIVTRGNWEDGHRRFPEKECVFKQGDWYWYIPPKAAGSLPRIATLAPATEERTVAVQYVWRALMTPFYAAGDMIFYPLYYCRLFSGGERNFL